MYMAQQQGGDLNPLSHVSDLPGIDKRSQVYSYDFVLTTVRAAHLYRRKSSWAGLASHLFLTEWCVHTVNLLPFL